MAKEAGEKGRSRTALCEGSDATEAGEGGASQDAQENGPRVGGYVRVSQERNLRNFGMDAQLAEIQRYATFRRWEVGKVYRENGVSGYKRKRPALDRLLADARAGKLDVVVFPSIDRAARSVSDMIDIDTALREENVTVVFVREGVDTSTPMGQFFRNICASVAQFEGKLMYERVSKGKRRKAEKGGYTGGWLPYGYRSRRRQAVVIEEEARVVRLIFRMRVKGKSYYEIADELRRREAKTLRGGQWRYGTVGGIIRNPFCAGWVVRADIFTRGDHEAIISVETFNKAQGVFHDEAERRRNEHLRIRLPEDGDAAPDGSASGKE